MESVEEKKEISKETLHEVVSRLLLEDVHDLQEENPQDGFVNFRVEHRSKDGLLKALIYRNDLLSENKPSGGEAYLPVGIFQGEKRYQNIQFGGERRVWIDPETLKTYRAVDEQGRPKLIFDGKEKLQEDPQLQEAIFKIFVSK